MAMDLGTILVNVKADTAELVSGFNRAESAVNKTTKQMSYAVKGLIGAFVGLNTLDIAKNFTKQLDVITSANNKLKLVTKSTQEFTNAQNELFKVAQLTSQGYSETVTLYSKLSNSMTAMGKSQSDIIRTVETVNKAIALSGA
ncbi:tape measure protein, partial [Chryseobacterium cucumeris]|uniref:tape measure protein n=1 Tax=Chryseobacterium cucumeris TaxID=1813611 RepID=UPI0023EF6EE6